MYICGTVVFINILAPAKARPTYVNPGPAEHYIYHRNRAIS